MARRPVDVMTTPQLRLELPERLPLLWSGRTPAAGAQLGLELTKGLALTHGEPFCRVVVLQRPGPSGRMALQLGPCVVEGLVDRAGRRVQLAGQHGRVSSVKGNPHD